MAINNYNPNTGAKLKKGETVTNKSTGQKVTQGTTFGSAGSYGSSSGGSSNSNPNNLNLYNPNTGQLLKQGETVNFNGQKVTQGTVFGSAGNYGYVPPANNIIPATNMGVNNQMNQKVEFPQAGNQENDYSWITSALSTNNPDGTPKNAQQVQTDQSNTNLAYLRSIMEPAPSSADAYRQAQRETGILQKQQLVGDLTGKLNAIIAQGEANKLSVIGQGRGIPEAIIGGQQAQMARETAIEALPVAAQLNAAQGNLQMAEQNLNTLFKIYSDDATNKYNQKQKVNEAFFSILTGQQKAQLDKIEKAETRAYNEQQNDLQYARQLAGKAFENNQGTLGSQIAALNPTSKTYKADVAKLSAKINDPSKALDIEYKKEQIKNLRNEASQSDIQTNTLSETQLKQVDGSPQGKKLVSLSNLYQLSQTYKKLVEVNGFKATGSAKSLIDRAYADLKIAYKTAAELGALTGPDVSLLEEAIKPSAGGATKYLNYRLSGGKQGVTGAIEAGLVRSREEALKNYKQLVSRNTNYGNSEYVRSLITPFAKDYATVNIDNLPKGEIMQTEDGLLFESLGDGNFTPL